VEHFKISHKAARKLHGHRKDAIVGVVASGNCEVLFERVLDEDRVQIEVSTAVTGFGEVWKLVLKSFVERASPGGARISINDGGATPDVVTLRLLQGAAMMETK
jgi:malonate decarboxylase delta subunit